MTDEKPAKPERKPPPETDEHRAFLHKLAEIMKRQQQRRRPR